MIVRVILIALACLLPSYASACTLSLPTGTLQGRIAGLMLKIQHASTQVAKFPPGWNISIDNDPSWETHITGRAIVGAAFLSGNELASMLKFSPEPGFSCNDLSQVRATRLTLTFYV